MYSNVVPLSAVMAEAVFEETPHGMRKEAVGVLDLIYDEKAKDGIFQNPNGMGSGKFPVRVPSGGAFLYALSDKFNNTDEHMKMIEKNVGYLLGDNGSKKSYVVGFNKNGANAPSRPHHRGYYGNENAGVEVGGAPNPPEKNKLLGGMIAGDFTSGNHDGNTSNWQTNEVCVDLNAPLVGALGYILSKKAPKTDEDLGIKSIVKKDTTKKDTVVKDTSDAIIPRLALAKNFNLTSHGSMVSVSQAQNMPFKVQVFDLTGKLLQEVKSEGKNLEFKIESKGVFRVRVMSARASEMFTVKAY